jgi:hypothetical protein
MAKRLIYVGQDDDVSDLAGKVQAADAGDDVGLVVPPGAQAFQTPLNLRLLRSVAMKRGLTTSVVTPDARVQELARGTGISVYSSVAAYDGGVPAAARRPGQPPFRDPEAPLRPRAPFLPQAGAPAGPGGGGSVAGSPPSGTGGWPAPASPPGDWPPPITSPGAAPFRDPALLAAPGAPPAPRESPWATPAPPPGGPVAPAPVAAVAQPRARSPWTTAGQDTEWDQPPPPWAAGRAPDGYGALPGATVLEPPPPVAPSVRPPAPPGRGPAGGPTPSPAPGGIRGLLHNRPALYGIGAAVVVVAFVLFLVLGSSATVTVTIAEQPLTVNPTIQGTAVAAQASQPNYVLTKVISDTATQTFPATPTGSQAVAAVAATGTVDLTAANFGDCIQPGPLFFQAGSIQFEAANPTGVEVLQAGESPPPTDQSCGNATYTAPYPALPAGFAVNTLTAAAVQAGTAGNVAADTITEWAPSFCSQDATYCTNITVYNPNGFTNGVNASTETVASASDLSNWQEQIGQVETQLGNQAQSDLQTKAAGERPAIDPGGNGKSITYTISPSSFPPAAAGTVMSAETVTVTMNAAETVYDPASVQAEVLADLKASTNLPSGDSLVPGQLSLNHLQIIEAGSDGTFAMSVSGVDYYRPSISLGQLRSQLAGHNPGDVSGIVKHQIPDVQSVKVDETPLQLFFMPFSSSRIQIVETFVARTAASS